MTRFIEVTLPEELFNSLDKRFAILNTPLLNELWELAMPKSPPDMSRGSGGEPKKLMDKLSQSRFKKALKPGHHVWALDALNQTLRPQTPLKLPEQEESDSSDFDPWRPPPPPRAGTHLVPTLTGWRIPGTSASAPSLTSQGKAPTYL